MPVQGAGRARREAAEHPSPLWDRGGACDSHHWLLFGVKTFKAVIEININDNCEE